MCSMIMTTTIQQHNSMESSQDQEILQGWWTRNGHATLLLIGPGDSIETKRDEREHTEVMAPASSTVAHG